MRSEIRPTGSDRLDVTPVVARGDLVRCGAELVALSERFYGGIFVAGVALVGLTALAALVVLPFRDVRPPGGALTPAVLAAGLLVALTPLAIQWARALYCILRGRRTAQVGLVLVAALLVAYPMRSQLWWPSWALLMLLAIVVPLPRVLAYCSVVVAVSAGSHVAGGDLDELPAVAIIGLCIGYPFWCTAVALSTDRLAAHLLRLNATRQRPRPRRVAAWTTRPPTDTAIADDAPEASVLGLLAGAAGTDMGEDIAQAVEWTGKSEGDRPIDRLTARQLQVVALLADGLRYREVADCLSISVRQVRRHAENAAARLGAHGVYELCAVAVAERLVPAPRGTAAPSEPA